METIRMMRPRRDQIEAILAKGPVIVRFGNAGAAQVIMLPADDFAGMISTVYNPGRAIVVSPIGLSESVVVRILRDQVDKDLQPWTYGELMVGQKVGAYLVPNAPWWMDRLEEGVGE